MAIVAKGRLFETMYGQGFSNALIMHANPLTALKRVWRIQKL